MATRIDIPLPEPTQIIESEGNRASIEIAGLYPGYGVTLGNALRRVLLSSLPGAAVTTVTFKNVPHEFTTVPGVKETVLDIILNIKQLRLKLFSEEPQMLELKSKGGSATAKDLTVPAQVAIVSEDLIIATLTGKKAELNMELTVERGVGYVPAEERKKQEKMPVGSIAVDAVFTPVRDVNFTVENMRVGDRTDYNRLRLDIETDGTMDPEEALYRAADILVGQFSGILPDDFVSTASAGGEDALGGEPLAVLGVTPSVIEKLEAEGVKNIGDLTKRSKKDLQGIKGVGAKAVEDIEKALKKFDAGLAEA